MEKLRLKNLSQRVKKRKLQAQLKQKEEAGEVRHEVDFEQLKIENKQYNERFDEKNQELLTLKLSAGNTLQVLNSYKVSPGLCSLQATCLMHTSSIVSVDSWAGLSLSSDRGWLYAPSRSCTITH